MVGIPNDDEFYSSPKPPTPFYEYDSKGGDDDITPEADDVEYVAPQERRAGEGSSGPPGDEAAEEDDDDEQLSQDTRTQFLNIYLYS